MQYRYLTTEQTLEHELKRLPIVPERCLDSETTSLDPHRGKPRLLQIGTPGHYSLLIDLFRIKDKSALKRHFKEESEKGIVYIGHHLKFDFKFMLRNEIPLPDVIHDTMIADQVLNAGKIGLYFSLNALSQRYLHKPLDKSLQAGGWAAPVLAEQQLQYASNDVDVPHPIYRIQRDLIQRNGLEYITDLEFRCIPVFADMELAGIKIDAKKLDALKRYLIAQKQKNEEYLYDKVFGVSKEVNIYSPQQLLKLLHLMGIDVPNTRKDTLRLLIPDYPFLEAFLKCKSIRYMLSNQLNKLPDLINPATGRIHTQFFQVSDEKHGAVTGRISSADPNLQSIPTMAKMREAFVAEEGNLFTDGDYSQIEIRVMAEIVQDQTLISIFQNGKDSYRATAAKPEVLNKSINQITSDERTKIKGIVLGLIFGMQVPSLRKYLMSRYNIHIDYHETERLFNGILDSWSSVKQYHRNVQRNQPSSTRTLKGRIRHFPSYHFNEAVNAPIQGSAADIIKLALVKLHKRLRAYDAKILLTVHDEILIECPYGQAKEVLALQLKTMQEAGEEILTTVPVIAEGGIGHNWKECKS